MPQLSWRLCEWCGVLYAPSRAATRTCSAECRLQHNRRKQNAKRYAPVVTRPCAHCGQLMITKWATKRTCSRHCRGQVNYQHQPVWHEKTCLCCGQTFVSKRSDARYCSSKCTNRSQYRAKRVERIAAAARWAAANRDRRRVIAIGYRARRSNWESTGAGVSTADWQRLVRRFAHRCAYCSALGPLHMEHVVPLSRGGQHAIGNILPACQSCNLSKGALLLVEWRVRTELEAAG